MTPPADVEGSAAGEHRYVYCLVPATDGFDPGAVVHDCDGVYDAEDPDLVRRWLLGHQRVVDEAAERFDAVLPFRFDVVFENGDSGVREWLDSNAERVGRALDRFAGRREYRIQLVWTDEAERGLREADEELADLADRVETADGGRAYLVEKQYENRLAEVRSERARALTDELAGLVDPVAVETTSHDRAPALSGTDPEPFARLAVLADTDDESALGERLDEIAERPEVGVRFTGPWAPYSFAPEFD